MGVSTESLQETSNITKQIDAEIEDLPQGNSSSYLLPLFTKWSPWSRCEDCLQRRMKKCISPKCKQSKMYEKRPCSKKRCKRKLRKQLEDDDFHLVFVEVLNKLLSKWNTSRIRDNFD